MAAGALANLHVSETPRAADGQSGDPDLEELLRLRRLRDAVEAMQARWATRRVQRYARRWLARHRGAAR